MTIIIEILEKAWDAATMFSAALSYQERMVALALGYCVLILVDAFLRRAYGRTRLVLVTPAAEPAEA